MTTNSSFVLQTANIVKEFSNMGLFNILFLEEDRWCSLCATIQL